MKKWLFGVFLLVAPALAVPPQLIQDGKFELAPAPRTISGLEEHAGASVWYLTSGNGQLPNWEISGRVGLNYFKTGERLINMLGKGTISQTIATEPGKWYYLAVLVSHDQEGGSQQALRVSAGSQTETMPSKDTGLMTFQAKSASTKIVLSGKSNGNGPYIGNILCRPFDPETIEIQLKLGEVYRDLDRGEKSESSIQKLLSRLTEDFTYKPLEGPALDLAGFEQLVRQRIERKYKVNSAVQDAVRNDDGSITLEVERREQKPGDYGKLESSTPHFKHTWVKVGSDWKLKSAEEVGPEP